MIPAAESETPAVPMPGRSLLRIAVSGYYGCGNTGDEAVLAGITESFRKRGVPAEFTVLSADPADTQRRHGIRAVDRMDMSVVRGTLAGSDLLLSGGGSLLQDTTSLRSLLYYLWIVRMAVARRIPVVFYAQGIGPLRRQASRILVRMVGNRVQQITVRDPDSARLLAQIGVRRPPVTVTADPAFALSAPPSERAREILAESGVPASLLSAGIRGQRPALVGAALRPWPGGPAPEAHAEMIRRISRESGAGILLLPMQAPGDVELSDRIAGLIGGDAWVLRNPGRLSASDHIAVMGALHGLIAMRLHALIFGAIAGTPLVALGYDPKVTSLMARLGQQERCMSLSNLDAAAAGGTVLSAMAESESVSRTLLNAAVDLREKALQNVDLALAAVG